MGGLAGISPKEESHPCLFEGRTHCCLLLAPCCWLLLTLLAAANTADQWCKHMHVCLPSLSRPQHIVVAFAISRCPAVCCLLPACCLPVPACRSCFCLASSLCMPH